MADLMVPAGLSKGASNLLEKIGGPASRELGEAFADRIRFWRWKNQVRLIEKADEFLHKRGAEASVVPPKILFPLLDAGSMEDSDSLLDLWGALLASAADPERREAVQPGFVELLRQLTPADVQVLRVFYEKAPEIKEQFWLGRQTMPEVDLLELTGLSGDTFEISKDNLLRLRLIQEQWTAMAVPRFLRAGGMGSVKSAGIKTTRLGTAFVTACGLDPNEEPDQEKSNPTPSPRGLGT